jgi:hypothetical protein
MQFEIFANNNKFCAFFFLPNFTVFFLPFIHNILMKKFYSHVFSRIQNTCEIEHFSLNSCQCILLSCHVYFSHVIEIYIPTRSSVIINKCHYLYINEIPFQLLKNGYGSQH